MEKYFDKYRGLLEEQEFEPQTTESQFLSRLHEREGGVKAFAESCNVLKPSKQSRWTKTLTYTIITIIGVAAAVVLALVLPWGENERLDPAEIYVTNYLDGVQPILAEVNAMESSSEVCREMGVSAVIQNLLGSSESFAEGLEGLDDAQRLAVTQEYCGRQLDCIRDLYRECCAAYASASL